MEVPHIPHDDLMDVMDWRNEQMDFLRQKTKLTVEDQINYYEDVIEPAHSATEPDLILYGFFYKGDLIGYGGLTHIDWESGHAELSFLTDPKRDTSYGEDFSWFLNIIINTALEILHLHRLWTETYDLRPRHIGILESKGFRLEGRMRDHVIIRGHYYDSLIHGLLA